MSDDGGAGGAIALLLGGGFVWWIMTGVAAMLLAGIAGIVLAVVAGLVALRSLPKLWRASPRASLIGTLLFLGTHAAVAGLAIVIAPEERTMDVSNPLDLILVIYFVYIFVGFFFAIAVGISAFMDGWAVNAVGQGGAKAAIVAGQATSMAGVVLAGPIIEHFVNVG